MTGYTGRPRYFNAQYQLTHPELPLSHTVTVRWKGQDVTISAANYNALVKRGHAYQPGGPNTQPHVMSEEPFVTLQGGHTS